MKAGLVATVVFLAIAILLEVTGISDRYPGITVAAGLNLGREPWRPSVETILLQTILRAGAGILFGVIFAALYDHLPGARHVVKGVMTSAFLWIVGAVQLTYVSLELLIHGMPPPWQGPVPLPSVGQVLVSIASVLVFGGLVGLVWGRLRPKEVAEVRRGMALLLIGWILGVLMWAYAAVYGGSLLAGGYALSWRGLLLVLSAFIGAAGWVFALLAWRRTRKGETGFRRGVAGGILMAVTGVMLLPGVVSIIGAVLSRRSPDDETRATVVG